ASTDKALTAYDARRSDLVASIESEMTASSYALDIGHMFLDQEFYEVDYSSGLSLFSASRHVVAKYYSTSDAEDGGILARASRKSQALGWSHEVRAKLKYKGVGLTISLGASLTVANLSDKPEVDATDP